MNTTRLKITGLALGLMAVGGLLGTAFSTYGGFANAASPGTTPQKAAKPDSTTPVGEKQGNTSQADMDHYTALFEQNFASQLGVDQSKLDPALRAAIDATVDQAVTDGKLGQDVGNNVKNKVSSLTLGSIAGNLPLGETDADAAKKAGSVDSTASQVADAAFAAGAQLLGISIGQFNDDLENGQLTQVAQAHNVTVAQLESTVETALRTQLNQVVSAGKMKQADSDDVYNAVKMKFEFALTNTSPAATPGATK